MHNTRSQKTKATRKIADRGVTAAVSSGQSEPKLGPGAAAAISAQQREIMVSRAAYFRAEKRGFVPGGELQDWVEAEAEIGLLTGAN